MKLRRFAADEEERFRLSRQLALAEINAHTFWFVAALVMAFSWWDWYVDPSNWFAAFVVRGVGAGVIVATGVVQKLTGRVDWSARIAKVRFAAGTVAVACALALLDRGFLVGVSGLVAVMLSAPYIAIDRRDLLVMNAAPLFLIAVIMWAAGLDSFTVMNSTVFILLALLVSLLLARVFEASNRRAFALEQQLTSEARTDAMTGLPNRRSLEEAATAEVKRGTRTGSPLAVIICDIDHFKQVNDRHGHDVGDRVLRAVADTLRTVARESDALGRWGGEEFLMVLPETDENAAFIVAERMRKVVEAAPMPVPGLKVTISLGVAGLLPGGSEPERWREAVRRADDAMYRSKAQGRNRVSFAEQR
ncbi:MAG TPA: GGDEF domain-containing protein [Usitatibacter sp.]|nr:GGDEF domain-containing protein [Usitatibacter sp.]